MEKIKEETLNIDEGCKLRVQGKSIPKLVANHNITSLSSLISLLDFKPKLHELQLLEFPDGKELRIIDTVAPKWRQVAIALGFEGPKIETIEMGAHFQPDDACLKMFIDWLSRGRDLTWKSLIQSLKAANLTEIANLLNSRIEIVSFTPVYNIE